MSEHTPGPWMFKHGGRKFRVMPDARIQKLAYDRIGAPVWVDAPVTEKLIGAAIAKATGSAA